ncbi:MAG TPA: glycosyltransferase family 39 protein [Chloroflexia bacterium]|nr:glycosyltransferase family 39 protein [Chloroflexia bacterium]
MARINRVLRSLNALGNRLPPLYAVLAISVVSGLVKLAYILVLGGGLSGFPTEGSDGSVFHVAAGNLLAHGVYGLDQAHPMVQPPPGEAAWLAGLYVISGHSLAVAKLAHVALLALTGVLTYFTGRLLFSAAAGLGAGLLLAIDPAQAYMAGTFLSEPLYIFLMTLGLYLVLRGRVPQQAVGWAVGAGLCFGLAGLTRNQGITFAAVLFAAAVMSRGRVLPWRMAAVTLGVALLVIAPWTYRNYLVSGHFIPISTNGGLTLWSSNNPDFIWRQPMPMSLALYDAPSGMGSYELDQFFHDQATAWIAAHPLEFAVNGLRKVIMLFNFDPASVRPEMANLFRVAGLFPYGLMLPFILLGLGDALRRRELWLLGVYVVMTTALAFVFWGDSRVRAPIQPYLYLLGTAWILQRLVVGSPTRVVGEVAGQAAHVSDGATR